MTRHFWAVQYRRFRETDRRVEPLMVVLDTRPPPAASSAICATPVRSFLINTPLDTLFRCVRETPDTLRLTNMEDHGSATVQHGLVFQLRPCGFRHVHFHLHGHVYPLFCPCPDQPIHASRSQSRPRARWTCVVMPPSVPPTPCGLPSEPSDERSTSSPRRGKGREAPVDPRGTCGFMWGWVTWSRGSRHLAWPSGGQPR